MHIWSDIFTRELAMLLALLALGSGPAAFLGRRFDPAARLAMAPVLGMCVGTCVFTTLIWFTAARNTYWLLPVLAAVSLAIALVRARNAVRDGAGSLLSGARAIVRSLPLRDAIALLLVVVIVAAPLSYTLHERHSVGPVGFEVWDAVGYTAEADGMTQQSIPQAEHGYKIAEGQNAAEAITTATTTRPRRSFVETYWGFTASGVQNIDLAPLSANLNELIGLHATDTQSLYLIAILVAGALGAFAAVRYAAPRPSWAAPFAGILFAGPFFLQLFADGSQAAICGLALILPLAALGAEAIRERRLANLVLFALAAAGLIALYPLFVFGVTAAALIVLGAVAVLAWRRRALTRRTLANGAAALAVVLGLSAAFSLVSFLRSERYWRSVLEGGFLSPGLPKYNLPVSVLPGWLLQTREFYFLTELGHAPAKQVLLGVVLPIVLILVIVYGVTRRRASLLLVPLVLVCAAIGEYTSARHACSYCTDRALLPIAPLGIGLLALGVATLATARAQWMRWAGALIAIVAVVAVAERARQERVRFANGSYFLDASSRSLLARVPQDSGSVDIEGYAEDPGKAPGELPLAYFLTWERNRGAVSVPTESSDYASLAYLGEANPRNPQFDPSYRYVLTRLGGVQTGRRVLARTGSLALEERASPLDVTVVSGLGLPFVRLDGQGLAWVEGPMRMIVTGEGSNPAWIAMRFRPSVPMTVPPQPGLAAQWTRKGEVAVCLHAAGRAPERKAMIALSFPLAPGIVPNEPFALPEPPQGVQLVAVSVAPRCSPPGRGWARS